METNKADDAGKISLKEKKRKKRRDISSLKRRRKENA